MSLNISRILHAGYIFEYQDFRIVFDPIFENPFSHNCYAFPHVEFNSEEIKKQKFDAIFISHYHDDHCSLESIALFNRRTPIYLYCIHEDLFSIIKELGFENVYSLKLNTSVDIGAIEVIPLRALDSDVDSIFHIKVENLNILNVVDSWIDPETINKLKKTEVWDIVLWPFQTMRELEVLSPSRATLPSFELPIEWVEQLKALNPKYIVPSSCQFIHENWSWYNQFLFPISYKNFEKQINHILPKTKVVRMNPSVTVTLQNDSLEYSKPLTWIKPVGDQNIDYNFNPSMQIPSSAEIAKHFDQLNKKQIDQVHHFCQHEIIEKYKVLELSSEEYFTKPRLWRLSLYDHNGEIQQFHYKINCEHIELTFEISEPLSWATEVPLSKLYSALYRGETLTSMYLRVNDRLFNPEIEKELQSVDPFEDPLIRCLFNGNFAAYQEAQLKRILAETE